MAKKMVGALSVARSARMEVTAAPPKTAEAMPRNVAKRASLTSTVLVTIDLRPLPSSAMLTACFAAV